MPCSHCRQSGHNITTCKIRCDLDDQIRCALVIGSACVKIQRAWRAYKPEHTCSICLSGIDKKDCCVTKCGHKFCLTCLSTSLQQRPTCPLCRATLVPEVNNDEDMIESYQNGLYDGRENTMAQARQLVEEREEVSYGRGLIDGRAITEDELDVAKAEITRLKFQVDNLRLDHRSMVANIQLDLIHHQNLIRDLKKENSCIALNLRKRMKAVCDIPHTE